MATVIFHPPPPGGAKAHRLFQGSTLLTTYAFCCSSTYLVRYTLGEKTVVRWEGYRRLPWETACRGLWPPSLHRWEVVSELITEP